MGRNARPNWGENQVSRRWAEVAIIKGSGATAAAGYFKAQTIALRSETKLSAVCFEIAVEVVGGYFASQLLPIPLVRALQHEAKTGLEIRQSLLRGLVVTPVVIEIDVDAPDSLFWVRI